ncbi:hypothetical protein ACFLTH_12560 [Bacteroidota bacterium]
MKKKGIANNLVYYIIILAVIFVTFSIITSFAKQTKDAFRDKGCLSSIIAKTFTNFEYAPISYKNEMNDVCPLYELIFYDNKFELKKPGLIGERIQTYKYSKLNYDGLNDDTVNDLIAKEVMNCWQKFGGGRVDAFYIPQGWLQELGGWFTSDRDVTGCRTCTIIRFELEEEQEFTGFINYIKEAKMTSSTRKKDSKGYYYYDYIANSERYCDEDYLFPYENCWVGFANKKKINIDEDFSFNSKEKEYYVVFVRQNTDKGEGTLNAYVMDFDTKSDVCKKTMPFY